MCLGESPGAVQNLGAGPIEAHHIIPALHNRQAIGNCTVAAAELDGDRTVLAFPRGDIVNGIGVKFVGLVIARRVGR
jgi:hypothetical protein